MPRYVQVFGMGNVHSLSLTDQRVAQARLVPGKTGRLAVILPGLAYGCDKPLLAGVSQLLARRGHGVLEISFGYRQDDHFGALPESAQIEAIEQDGAAILKWALNEYAPERLVLVGKSLGTVALGGMAGQAMPAQTRAVWLTPSLTGTPLLGRIRAFGHPALSLIGSDDVSAPLARAADYRQIAGLTHVEVPGLDHGWQHRDGEAATRKGLFIALALVENWLDSAAQLDKHGVM